MKNIHLNSPPKGFTCEISPDGYTIIKYKTSEAGYMTIFYLIFFSIWIIGWTLFCIILTVATLILLFRSQPEFLLLSLFAVLSWSVDFWAIRWILWRYLSITSYTLHDNHLIFEKSLYLLEYKFIRKKVIPKNDIKGIRQTNPNYSESASIFFPSRGLVVEGKFHGIENFPILHLLADQELSKSSWLGPILAQWAQVPFIPCRLH